MFGIGGVKDHTPVGLTTNGKRVADNAEGDGARFMVLFAIAENGGVSTPEEISQETKIPTDKVKAAIERLKKAGYVKVTKGD